MKSQSILPALVSILIGAAAGAASSEEVQNGVLTYELFEHAVEHADLETCPTGYDNDAVFCRLTLANEQAHVFVFSHNGDQPLVAIKALELTDTGIAF
ncbi:hypothetical protein [uncultured Tateyamaria sp.]|uniref:hypothetical protein n=1 Tax=uncultured Tateyamaria sp. TaxID=455651 RepID=UPI00262319DF|nr:hypothetical protein [uncultured Tateyamaria sp.]